MRCDCRYPNDHSGGSSGKPVISAYNFISTAGSLEATTKMSKGSGAMAGAVNFGLGPVKSNAPSG